MTLLTEADLEPFTQSAYAWRWCDPKRDVLPDDVLRSIRALRRGKAREYFQENLFSEWLQGCGADTEMVIVSWSEDEAVYLPWAVFRKYWSVFCYTSSDDVTVWPLDERWGLSFAHWGVFSWRLR